MNRSKIMSEIDFRCLSVSDFLVQKKSLHKILRSVTQLGTRILKSCHAAFLACRKVAYECTRTDRRTTDGRTNIRFWEPSTQKALKGKDKKLLPKLSW